MEYEIFVSMEGMHLPRVQNMFAVNQALPVPYLLL